MKLIGIVVLVALMSPLLPVVGLMWLVSWISANKNKGNSPMLVRCNAEPLGYSVLNSTAYSPLPSS